MQDHYGSAAELRPLLDSAPLVEALNHWESLRPPGGLPSRADFDPMAIAPLLSAVILLDVCPDGRFIYRLAGQVFEDRYQVGSLAGKTPEEVLGDVAEKVLVPYRRVRDTGCLFYRIAEVDWLNRDPSFNSYHALLLPFTDGGGSVDKILGAFDFTRR